jgi:hypothetical protein
MKKKLDTAYKICKIHGLTDFGLSKNRSRCRKCQVESVLRRRQRVKEKLVAHFGGKCSFCGYDKYIGGLEFHHLLEEAKDFGISGKGLTLSYEKMLAEANKCILVCALCHRELHAGLLPIKE